MRTIIAGDRVRLCDFLDDGIVVEPEVTAIVVGVENEVITVEVVPEYRRDLIDIDGLREITADQIKEILS